MITSKDNEKIKYLKKLTSTKHRKKEGKFLVDDLKTFNEGIKKGFKPLSVFLSKDFGNLEIPKSCGVFEAKHSILASISGQPSFSGIIAVFEIPKFNEESMVLENTVILDGVQNPENVGAVLRSAAMFGFKSVILSDKSADPFSLKSVRASKGGIFHLKVARLGTEKIINLLENFENIYFAEKEGGESIYKIEIPESKTAIVFGSEGSGITEDFMKIPHKKITIPTTNAVDSLNIAVSCGIIMSRMYGGR